MTQTAATAPLGIRVTTYAELEQIVGAFARGDLTLLILVGGHGLGKTRIVRQALRDQACCRATLAWIKADTQGRMGP